MSNDQANLDRTSAPAQETVTWSPARQAKVDRLAAELAPTNNIGATFGDYMDFNSIRPTFDIRPFFPDIDFSNADFSDRRRDHAAFSNNGIAPFLLGDTVGDDYHRPVDVLSVFKDIDFPERFDHPAFVNPGFAPVLVSDIWEFPRAEEMLASRLPAVLPPESSRSRALTGVSIAAVLIHDGRDSNLTDAADHARGALAWLNRRRRMSASQNGY